MKQELYVDEPCFVSFFCGELGWLCQYYQSLLRYMKNNMYQDRKFIIMMDTQFHVLVHDFTSYTVDLPDWFKELQLEKDCFESPLPGSPPGSLTPPDVYAKLIEYFRQFYNPSKAIEFWPPRGTDKFWPNHKPSMYARYSTENSNRTIRGRPYVCVCPRGRSRAAIRNVPEYVWRELVDILREDFYVVLCGTPSGSFLADYQGENVINLIPDKSDDKFEKVMDYMCKSVACVSSQSGLTHVGLLCGTPSLIIGHEKDRHCIAENRFETPCSFRYVYDYRAIDATTVAKDLAVFLDALMREKIITIIPENSGINEFDCVLGDDINKLNEIIQRG